MKKKFKLTPALELLHTKKGESMKSSALSTFLMGSLMLLAAFTPALAFAKPIMAPGMCVGDVSGSSWYSTNWSGYVVNGSAGSVTFVNASWTVPTVTGSAFRTAYSSFWVGIDGFIGSSTVEQIGTDSDIHWGKPVYYAWYEFYPAEAMQQISGLTINPGDVISASVTYSSGVFTLLITDVSTGASYTTTGTVSGATETSAEWVAEAPSSYFGVLPLANFGKVNYGYDNTGVTATCQATVNGVTGSIGSFGAALQNITMAKLLYNFRSHSYTIVPKAVPSALSTDGTSFSVTWYSS
jgi:hypothetical protein